MSKCKLVPLRQQEISYLLGKIAPIDCVNEWLNPKRTKKTEKIRRKLRLALDSRSGGHDK